MWAAIQVEFYFNTVFHWFTLHRGLSPQNKPELQKVLEKRKREQVLKAQKEEQEAHKKSSDLEIELMKRQQKLEQVNKWERQQVPLKWIYFVAVDHEAKQDVIYVAQICLFVQLELEQQKIEEEQENTPEFVKMKSNLRRTKQETDGEERTT